MYFITAMNSILTEKTPFSSDTVKQHTSRCFGDYLLKKDAVDAVKQNQMDMWETMYDYIVIEKIDPGIHATAEVVGWFQYNEATDTYEPIEVGHTGFCNYAIG